MKTKLTLLKKALFVAAGVFMLTACSDDDKAAGPGTTAEMAGDYKGTVTFRKPGAAGAIFDGAVLSTAERMVNVQAVSATEVKFSGSDNTSGKVYSFDFNAKVVGISDGMILAADNVSYTYNGDTHSGANSAASVKQKPQGLKCSTPLPALCSRSFTLTR